MKLRSILRVFCLTLVLMCTLSITVFADEMPIDKATEDEATVSDEVDTATGEDPNMDTTYFMFMEPDLVVTDPPQMGVEDPHTDTLILQAVAAGAMYLGVSIYAYSGGKKRAS